MPDIEAVEVLQQAKERLFEHGWRRGSSILHPEPGMCLEECLVGERGRYVHVSRTPTLVQRAAQYVKQVTGTADTEDLWEFNDAQSSASPIFDALDGAMALAKESPAP